MATLRVLILHYSSPPIIGGVETTIYHHARLLAEGGHSVVLVVGRGESFAAGVQFQPLPLADSRDPEILVVQQSLAEGTVSGDFERLSEQIFIRIRQLIDNSDVIIAHNVVTLHKNLPLTAALYRITQQNSLPVIAWSHDFAWEDPLYLPHLHPGFPWDLLRRPWPGVRYVTISEDRRASLSHLLGIPETEVAIIPPGVDIYMFLGVGEQVKAISSKLGLLESDPLILLPARLTRRKNIEFAIQVTSALKVHKPKVKLVVTGPPGPHNPNNLAYLTSLEALVRELGLEESVSFLYQSGVDNQPLLLPDSAVAEMYRLADLLLFPSLREGFGIPILEAGLARLPVFSADLPPMRKSAGEYADWFDPQGDAWQVAADIVARLESDRAYKLRRRVMRKFTWQAIVENQLIPLLKEVV